MEYRQLGRSGLKISTITMGTMTFGGVGWAKTVGDLGADDARRLVDICIDAGVNLMDTADAYSQGVCEEIIGEIMDKPRRDKMMIATKARFAIDEIVITSKLIDGTFPDYERVIPRDNDKMLDVDRKLLADAVDRVSAISSEKSRAVKLTLGAGVLKLSASSPEHGLAEEEIEVDYNGDGLEIGFNAAYLLDITRQIEGDTASLAMADAASPTVLRETADDSALFVLMPMRV